MAAEAAKDKITEYFSSDQEVLDALEIADGQATSSFEMQFVADLRARHLKWGMGSFMSEKQYALLNRIIDKRHK